MRNRFPIPITPAANTNSILAVSGNCRKLNHSIVRSGMSIAIPKKKKNQAVDLNTRYKSMVVSTYPGMRTTTSHAISPISITVNNAAKSLFPL